MADLRYMFVACLVFVGPGCKPRNAAQLQTEGSTSRTAVRVDLSQLFRNDIAQQHGPDCHIFAGTALIEATCERERLLAGGDPGQSDAKLDISETYLLYRHVRNSLKAAELGALSPDKQFTALTDGFVKKTLDTAVAGAVCLEEELPVSEANFINFLQGLVARNTTIWVGKKYLKPQMASLCQSIDNQVSCAVGDMRDGNFVQTSAGVRLRTKSAALAQCLAQINPPLQRQFSTTSKPGTDAFASTAKKLLTQGIPFVCSAQVNYVGRSYEGRVVPVIEQQPQTPKADKHAFIVAGFEDDQYGNTRFLIRDSNNPYFVYAAKIACEEITVLTLKRDPDLLQSSFL